MYRLLVLAVLVFPVVSMAQVFKCVDGDGRTTYSQAPCMNAQVTEMNIHNQARGPQLPAHGAVDESERLALVMAWFKRSYPQTMASVEPMELIAASRNRLIAQGETPAEALVRSILSVAPSYESQAQISQTDRLHSQARPTRGIAVSGISEAEPEREPERPKRRATVMNAPGPVIDAASGTVMTPVAGGVVDPRNGMFYPRVGGGYINPHSGEFIPSP